MGAGIGATAASSRMMSNHSESPVTVESKRGEGMKDLIQEGIKPWQNAYVEERVET